jgi:hypothetical protein
MVNPTGAVSSSSSVDDRTVAQLKQESVIWIPGIASRLSIGGTFADTSSAIFDNLRPLANGADRKYAAPMNRRATDAPGFAFLHGAVAEKGPLPLQRIIDTIESSCTARPTKIGRHDVLDRFRQHVELTQTRQGPARDIVRLEQVDLAGGEQRVRQEFE